VAHSQNHFERRKSVRKTGQREQSTNVSQSVLVEASKLTKFQ